MPKKGRRGITTWQLGQRVGLIYYPFCDGSIYNVKRRVIIAGLTTDNVYRVKWDNPLHGISGWLTFDELLEVKNDST